jgi:hypothetical protein
MENKLNPISKSSAKRRGLKPLTIAYEIEEYRMMARVMADMRRGGITHAIVREDESNSTALSVWRS